MHRISDNLSFSCASSTLNMGPRYGEKRVLFDFACRLMGLPFGSVRFGSGDGIVTISSTR